jgi:uncharacterized protein YqgC (DUF456 family)
MLDFIATILLAGLMLIPAVNVLVGVVSGGASFGVPGALVGGCLGAFITLTAMQFRSPRLPPAPVLANIIAFPTGYRIRHSVREFGHAALQSIVAKVVSVPTRWLA